MSPGLRWTAGILLAVVLVGGLAAAIDLRPADLAAIRLRPLWSLAAFGLYLPCLLLRSLRMLHLETPEIAREIGLARMMAMLGAHAGANHVLPMRLGELTYATLARGAVGTGLTGRLGVTALMRLADLFGLALVVGLAALAADLATPGLRLPLAGAALGVGLVALLGLSLGGPALARLTKPLARRPESRLARLRAELIEAVGRLQDRRRLLLAVCIESALLWLSLVALHLALGRAVGLDLGFAEMAVGALGSILMTFVPVGAVLNLGTVEAGWIATLAMVGVTGPAALALGLGVHLGLVATTGIYGLGGLVWLLARRR